MQDGVISPSQALDNVKYSYTALQQRDPQSVSYAVPAAPKLLLCSLQKDAAVREKEESTHSPSASTLPKHTSPFLFPLCGELGTPAALGLGG